MIKFTTPLGLLVLATSLIGCNMGMAPSGGSKEQVEANFQQMDAKDQIKIIEGSPASPERKAQLIDDIKKKYGIKGDVQAPVGGGSQSHPAPTTTGG